MARGGINKAVVQKARNALLARGAHPSEPPRVSRRLHLLREWSPYEQVPQVFPRSP